MRTSSGPIPGFTAGGPAEALCPTALSFSTRSSQPIFGDPRSCVRLQLSLAGGAEADRATDSLDSGVLPVSGGGGGRACLPTHPAPVALPGKRCLTSSAGGPQTFRERPHLSRNWAVRACSPSSANAVSAWTFTTAPGTPADLPAFAVSASSSASASGTPADPPASVVSAPSLAFALGTTATNSSHAAHSPLLTQGGMSWAGPQSGGEGTEPTASASSLPHSPLPTYLPRWAGRSGGEPPTTNLFAVPATDSQSRAGLIEQSKSTRPAGLTPAGITTQGEEI